MKIKFLGTAAFEGIPALFCECAACARARKNGGKDLRTRTQALIDDTLLIDFPADTLIHCHTYGIDLSKIEHCLITHTHSDHLYPDDLIARVPGFSSMTAEKPFRLYGHSGAMEYVGEFLSSRGGAEVVKVNPLKLYTEYSIGGFKVTALRGYHDEASYPVIYIIENSEGKRLLYGNDTNYFYDEVWEYLEAHPCRLDCAALDCTAANEPKMGYVGHMNLNDNVKVRNRLLELGCADENTIFCSNHFSHNGKNVLYDEFSECAAEYGFLTSFDGMEIDF